MIELTWKERIENIQFKLALRKGTKNFSHERLARLWRASVRSVVNWTSGGIIPSEPFQERIIKTEQELEKEESALKREIQ